MTPITSIPQYGEHSNDVMIMQLSLISKGFSVGPDGADEKFGPMTKAALSQFQQANHLFGSGVPGPLTIKYLDLVVQVPVAVAPMTQDLAGRMVRHLHPQKRVEIEAAVFPGRIVPDCFLQKDVQACYALVMRKIGEQGWHEVGGNNHGLDVGEIQATNNAYVANGDGDAWCMNYGQMGIAFLEDYFQKESPVLGSSGCMNVFRAALNVPDLVSKVAEVGTMMIAKHGTTDEGHDMAILEILTDNKVTTSEGNTSITSIRDGDGSGIKTRDQNLNGDLITQGWVRIYAGNKLPD